MARAHFKKTIRAATGKVVQNAACNLYEQGTVTPITDMWDSRTGGSALSLPLVSNEQGEIEAWLDTPQFVDVEVTDNSDAAFHPWKPSQTLSWTTFVETEVANRAPEDQGVAAFDGARVGFSGGANVSVPNDTLTTISTWNASQGTSGYWSAGSPSRLTILETGVYRVRFTGRWNANATGKRHLNLVMSGVFGTGPQVLGPGAAENHHQAVEASQWALVAGAYVEAAVYQNSGGALNLFLPDAGGSAPFTIQYLGPLS